MTQFDDQAGEPAAAQQAEDVEVRVARELLERARVGGVSLVGAGGLLAGVTKTVLQAALDAEMVDHLGFGKGERPPFAMGNDRNGTSARTVLTEVGAVLLEVPRDRAGKFDPRMVPEHARRVEGFNVAIVSLYGKGLTTGEIRAHLAEIYGVEVSRDLISRVTDRVADELAAWQCRPLRVEAAVGRFDMLWGQSRPGSAVGAAVRRRLSLTVREQPNGRRTARFTRTSGPFRRTMLSLHLDAVSRLSDRTLGPYSGGAMLLAGSVRAVPRAPP